MEVDSEATELYTDFESDAGTTQKMVAKSSASAAKGKLFTCSYSGCCEAFVKSWRLDRHLRRHARETPYLCTEDGCKKGYTCREYLNRHIKRVHRGEKNIRKRVTKTYTCDQCNKVFKQKFAFTTHVAKHTGAKPFKCDQCESSFALKSRLKRHVKTHSGYKCNHESCHFTGTTWGDLRKHTAEQHKLYHVCDMCEKKFPDPSKLHLHKLSHDGVKLFKCTYEDCSKVFTKNSNLSKHVRIIHEKIRFTCSHQGCDKEFKHKKTLIAHQKTHDSGYSAPVRTVSQVVRRACTAEFLSGYAAEDSEKLAIMKEDKRFRQDCSVNIGS